MWEGSALTEIGAAFDEVREKKKLHPEVQQYPFGDFSSLKDNGKGAVFLPHL